LSQNFSLKKVFYTSRIPELKEELDRMLDEYNGCDDKMFMYTTTQDDTISSILTRSGCLYVEEVIIIDDLD